MVQWYTNKMKGNTSMKSTSTSNSQNTNKFILQCIENLGIREGPNVYKSLPMLKATCLVNNYNKIYHRGSCTIKQGQTNITRNIDQTGHCQEWQEYTGTGKKHTKMIDLANSNEPK